MHAFGRLWQRAPVWRGFFLMGCISAGLTATYSSGLFQPQLHGAVNGNSSYTAAIVPPAPGKPFVAPNQPLAVSPASVAPAAGPPPLVPVFGQGFHGAVPFVRRLLPLPAGDWVVVGVNEGKAITGQHTGAVMLARLDQNQLLGVVVAFAADYSDSSLRGISADYGCQAPRVLSARIFSAVDHGPQDNWCIDVFKGVNWDRPQQPTVLRAGVGELRQRGVALPQFALRAYFVAADKVSWLKVNYFFDMKLGGLPESTLQEQSLWAPNGFGQPSDRKAFLLRVRDWAARWHSLIKRAFSRDLSASDITIDLADVH